MLRPISWTSADGLTLRGSLYGEASSHLPTITCLPGLTRNSKDFHILATELARHGARIFCFDYRGRGRSDYDPDWQNYNPVTEAHDVWTGLVAAGVHKTTLIGTSRGGILAMILGVTHPALLSAVILNDVGPELALNGLMRLKQSLSTNMPNQSWQQATATLKKIARTSFPTLSDEEWQWLAKATYRDQDGMPKSDFDANILKPLNSLKNTSELPSLWPQFRSLNHVPVFVLRGALSDILTECTLQRMMTEHPDCTSHTVLQQGHAPLFSNQASLQPVLDFIKHKRLLPA